MEKIRVGVIGCGRVSSVYIDAWNRLSDDIEVVFAVDKEKERAKILASHFTGCGYSCSIQDLIVQKPDVVHILTPHFLHKQHTVLCLNAGIHVLTEKPIATTIKDADEMINAAKSNQKQLGVISQNRYIEGIQEAKRLIEQGRLGTLKGAFSNLNWWRPPSYYQCDWKGSWEKEGGGVVIDQAIHSLDLVRFLMGCDAVQVNAHIGRRILTEIEVEDVADAAIRFENNAVYSFYACNYFTENSPIQVEISGENGTVHLSGEDVAISISGQPPRIIHPSGVATDAGEGYWGRCHYLQLKDFYRCIRTGEKAPVDPEDARKTLKLVLDLYRSAKEHRTVEC